MADSLSTHLATICSTDLAAHERWKNAIKAAEIAAAIKIADGRAADFSPARRAGSLIKRTIRAALDPHRVEFRLEHDGFTMFWAPPRVVPYFDFKVWPKGMKGRLGVIDAHIGTTDAGEFRQALATIKAAADVLAAHD